MNRTSGGDLAKEHPCGEIENMGYVSIDQPLDLKLSLTIGQAFRWQSENDGWYCGVLRGFVTVRWNMPDHKYLVLIDGMNDTATSGGDLAKEHRVGIGSLWRWLPVSRIWAYVSIDQPLVT